MAEDKDYYNYTIKLVLLARQTGQGSGLFHVPPFRQVRFHSSSCLSISKNVLLEEQP